MSAISTVTSLYNILAEMKGVLDKRKQKKEIGNKLVNVLGNDIEDYMKILEEVGARSQTDFVPLVESIEDVPSKSQIDKIVVYTTQMQLDYSELLEIVIRLAKSCNIVSGMEGFMTSLMNSNIMVGDFVKVLGNAYVKKNDSVKIEDDLYIFFKLNEKQMLKDLKAVDVEKTAEQFGEYVRIIKKKVIPYITVSSISRENRRKFTRSLEKLNRTCKRIKVKKTYIADLRIYTPAKLLPIVVLMEESLSFVKRYLKRHYPIHTRRKS